MEKQKLLFCKRGWHITVNAIAYFEHEEKYIRITKVEGENIEGKDKAGNKVFPYPLQLQILPLRKRLS